MLYSLRRFRTLIISTHERNIQVAILSFIFLRCNVIASQCLLAPSCDFAAYNQSVITHGRFRKTRHLTRAISSAVDFTGRYVRWSIDSSRTMHAHKARAIQRRLVNAGLTLSDRVCMHARTHARTHACLRTRMHHSTCPCLLVSPMCARYLL